MSNFPDDADETGIAYLSATCRDYGYGKVYLTLRLPVLRREYPLEPVELTHSAQFGGAIGSPHEPSYAWRLLAGTHYGGLDVENLDRTARAVRTLQKSLAALEKVAGPASTLAQRLTRLVSASKVKYFYAPDDPDQGGLIPDMWLAMPERDGLESIHNRIQMICTAVAKARP